MSAPTTPRCSPPFCLWPSRAATTRVTGTIWHLWAPSPSGRPAGRRPASSPGSSRVCPAHRSGASSLRPGREPIPSSRPFPPERGRSNTRPPTPRPIPRWRTPQSCLGVPSGSIVWARPRESRDAQGQGGRGGRPVPRSPLGRRTGNWTSDAPQAHGGCLQGGRRLCSRFEQLDVLSLGFTRLRTPH